MSNSNIKKMTNAGILKEYKLKKLIRYNHRNRICDESVAEHSFFVSLFCLKIMANLELDSETERKVLVYATLHDLPESETSDIPHDVKIKHPVIDEVLKNVEKRFYLDNYLKYYNDIYSDNALVNGIVNLADAYSVKQFCLNEIELGNKSDSIIAIMDDTEPRIEFWTNELEKLYEQYMKINGGAKNAEK